jgi:hypothetical protein
VLSRRVWSRIRFRSNERQLYGGHWR